MIRNGLLQSIGLQSGPNVHHIIESPQVSDGQTPEGLSLCPERGIGQPLPEVGSWIVDEALLHYGIMV
jgi:hypothetical protein